MTTYRGSNRCTRISLHPDYKNNIFYYYILKRIPCGHYSHILRIVAHHACAVHTAEITRVLGFFLILIL